MVDKLAREHWHPGFVGAIELELRDYKAELDFEGEHQLSKEPLQIDLLVIKKKKGAIIKNQIGEFFRQHNIFEFKSPRDGLTIDDFIKTVGYAYLYKGLGKYVNEIPFSELTVTLVRDTMPEGLFRAIEKEGGIITERHPGIYSITGVVNIPTQFILTSRLESDHTSLRLLTEHAQETDVINFLESAIKLQNPGDRQNIDAVLSVSSSVNYDVYNTVSKRGEIMSDAMLEIMKDVIQEREQKAVDNSLVTVIRNLMKSSGWDADKIMDGMGLSQADQARYAALL